MGHLSTKAVRSILSTVRHIEKLYQKPVLTRTDLTAFKIQENIKRYNSPSTTPNLSSLVLAPEQANNPAQINTDAKSLDTTTSARWSKRVFDSQIFKLKQSETLEKPLAKGAANQTYGF